MVEKKPSSSLSVFIAECVRGATQPSFPALVGTLVVAIAAMLMCVTLITPDLLANKGYGYIIESPEDEYAYLTSEVLRIQRSKHPELAVALIGSSFTREAITHAEHLEGLLYDRLQRPVTVYNLSVAGLRIWDMVCVADCIQEDFRGIIVIPVSSLLLSSDMDTVVQYARFPRLALDSEFLDSEVQRLGVKPSFRTGNYFLDHHRFFLARPTAIFNLVLGPSQPKLHMAEDWRRPTKEEWAGGLRRQKKFWMSYKDCRDINLAIYKRLIDHLKNEKGVEVALLEGARIQEFDAAIVEDPETREIYYQYHEDVSRFAEENGVPYWELSQVAGLKPADFVDRSHIRDPDARRRFTEKLGDSLSAMMLERKLVTGVQ